MFTFTVRSSNIASKERCKICQRRKSQKSLLLFKMRRPNASTEPMRNALLDKKIQFHQKAIEQLESRKAKIGSKRRLSKLTYAKVFAELKASGKTPEEIAEFLNK
jgi:hypothetical protein